MMRYDLSRELRLAKAAKAIRLYVMIDHHNFVVAVLIGAGFMTDEAEDIADDAARIEMTRRRAFE